MILGQKKWDIIVIGGGNAALCAAITARKTGASVVLLEAAPKSYRGGNSRHTRNFRCMHLKPLGYLQGQYSEEEYFEDLLQVTEGETDIHLAQQTISRSESCYGWMEQHGVFFQKPLSGTLSLNRTNAFFLGGGKALVNAYYRTAEKLGIHSMYDAHVEHLELKGNRIESIEVTIGQDRQVLYPKKVIVASGGFQANIEWLTRAWGTAAKNFLIRGTPYNRGKVLADLLEQGIETIGDPTQCHAVAIDGRAPKFDGGIVTRLDCVPFSVVVNSSCERFYDEGEDVWPKRYAIWGRLVAAQADQLAYAIIDKKSIDLFMPSAFPPVTAGSLEQLAAQLDLSPHKLSATVHSFNAACQRGPFSPTTLDGLSTKNISPAKTNWARPIDTPPFYAYQLRPGVTFTYMGLKVDENAQVQHKQGAVENLWAAGEIMAGSILGRGYLAGFGMTIGTVFGRIAGENAAKNI